MRRFRTVVLLATVIGLFATSAAPAAVVFTTTAESAPTGTVDFNDFPLNFTDVRSGVNTTASDGETVRLSGTAASSDGAGTYGRGFGLSDNGAWGSPKQYALIQPSGSTRSTLRLTFVGGGVQRVSGFMNYTPSGQSDDAVLTAFNASGVSLGRFELPTYGAISTPGGYNAGAYRGITSDAGDIAAIEITGRYVVLDDVSFARQAAPEPSGLLAAAAAAVALSRRRRA